MKLKLLTILFLFWSQLTLGSEFLGKVITVKDGDTLLVMVDDQYFSVRINGIDAPEKKQSYGKESTEVASKLVLGKEIKLNTTEKDRYGRTLSFVSLIPGGTDFSQYMISKGAAWHYKQYNKNPLLSDLENKARESKIGLWSEPNPIPPWEFRKVKHISKSLSIKSESRNKAIKTKYPKRNCWNICINYR